RCGDGREGQQAHPRGALRNRGSTRGVHALAGGRLSRAAGALGVGFKALGTAGLAELAACDSLPTSGVHPDGNGIESGARADGSLGARFRDPSFHWPLHFLTDPSDEAARAAMDSNGAYAPASGAERARGLSRAPGDVAAADLR